MTAYDVGLSVRGLTAGDDSCSYVLLTGPGVRRLALEEAANGVLQGAVEAAHELPKPMPSDDAKRQQQGHSLSASTKGRETVQGTYSGAASNWANTERLCR